MKKAFLNFWPRSRRTVALTLMAAVLLLGPTSGAAAPIQVFCWSLTPPTQAVRQGLERVLQQSVPIVAAAGEPERAVQLSRQLAQERLQVLVVLGTQALMAAAPRIKRTPIIFAMVADPFQTGAAYDPSRPEIHQENITGLASPPPLGEAFLHTKRLFPQRRHWGLIYNPWEGASVELQRQLTGLAAEAGLTLTVQPAATASAAQEAVAHLRHQGVEIFYLPPDQFSQTYAPALLTRGREQHLLIVNGNPRIEGKGAVLSVTLDYEAVGEEAGRLVQRVLAGERPKNIPIARFSPVRVEADEALLQRWAGYPLREKGRGKRE